ncbi:MAG: hypothetical protein IT379_39455 [Deltaproteobacteria bacterium]|nr:hypothetical protein [Deltaproteobacteria bacterium]
MVTFTNVHTADVGLPGVPDTQHASGYTLQPGASVEIDEESAAKMLENPGLRIYVAGKMVAVDGIQAPKPSRGARSAPVVIGPPAPIVVRAPEPEEPAGERTQPSSPRRTSGPRGR